MNRFTESFLNDKRFFAVTNILPQRKSNIRAEYFSNCFTGPMFSSHSKTESIHITIAMEYFPLNQFVKIEDPIGSVRWNVRKNKPLALMEHSRMHLYIPTGVARLVGSLFFNFKLEIQI